MRSIEEIKQEITAEYIKHPAVAARYGLEKGKTFEEQFSKLSVESLLFYTVATAIYSIEWIRDTFLKDVERAKKECMTGSTMWYRQQCLRFEYNTESTLVWDADSASWKYEKEDPSKRIVAACSVTTENNTVLVKVNKNGENRPEPLDNDTELPALKAFIDKIKVAGTNIGVISVKPDLLNCEMTVYFDPLVIKQKELEKKVKEASDHYLQNLPFGGAYDINKHMQSIMTIDGVSSIKPLNINTINYSVTASDEKHYNILVTNGKIEKTFISMYSGYINTETNEDGSQETSKILFNYANA